MTRAHRFAEIAPALAVTRGFLVAMMLLGNTAWADGGLSSEVLFHASFDSGYSANKAQGEPTAKAVGKVPRVAGVRGQAVVVGPDGWLEYALEGNINKAGGAGSIEMWVKPLGWDGAQPKEATLLSAEYENEGKTPDLLGLFRLYNLPDVARLTFIAGPYPVDSPEKQVVVQSEVTDWRKGQWHHLVATWDGFSVALYIDGELKQQRSVKAMSGSGENPRFVPALGRVFSLGAKPWGKAGETVLDEVTIYRSALLPEDVIERFNLVAEAISVYRTTASPPVQPATPAARPARRSDSSAAPVKSAPALRITHTIFSHNDTLQVAMDLSELTSLEPADIHGEVLIKDRQDKVLVRDEILSFSRDEEKRTLSISSLAAGPYTLEGNIRDRSGRAVGGAAQPFQVFRRLPGEGNRLGITDDAPDPWTPVQVDKENRVSVWGRLYDFGPSILPRQVVTAGRPLLSAPMAYDIQLHDAPSRRVESGSLSLVEQKPGRVVLKGIYDDKTVQIKQTLIMEFDGMIRCDAEVLAEKPIRRLALEIPLREDRARLFHAAAWRGKFTSHLPTPLEIGPAFRWSSLYLYPVMWIADMQGGLSWFSGSDRTWVVDRNREKLTAAAAGMRVNFIDTDSTNTSHIRLTYGLQAFPTRPPRPDWREFGRVLEAKWMPVFTPDPTNEQQKDGLVPEQFFRELIGGAAHRRERALLLPLGNFPRSVEEYTSLSPDVYAFSVEAFRRELATMRQRGWDFIAPYLTPTYSSDAIPEWKFYWSNWTMVPKARFDEDGESGVCVANAQWRDFWLQAFHDYVKKHAIKGVFHDMAGPYADEGELNGLGYTRNGVRYPEYPIWECREIFKRIYITHRQLFPDAMSVMNYGDFTPPVHSFSDFLLAAERYQTRADRSIYEWDGDGNIAPFTYQTSLPFGPKAMHNGWLKYEHAINEKEPTVHMYGLVLLHDLVQWNINENPDIRRGIHAMKKRFGIGFDRQVVFQPYWEIADKYRVDSKDILLSLYRVDSRLLAVIVNKSLKNFFQGTVELSTRSLGIDSPQAVEVFDPLAGSYDLGKAESADGRLLLKMEIKPTLFKAVLVH